MKKINDEKSSDSFFSGKKHRRRIQTLSVNLSGAQKRKKVKCDRYTRYRLTPNHPIFAEVTLANEDHREMFTTDLPNNTNNWACSY